jgi:hypothetical protein
MSNKSIPYKSLKAWQETDYPVSLFLALPCICPKAFSYKGFVSRETLSHATKASEAPHRWSLSGASVVLRSPAGASSTTKPHVAPLRADA